MTQEVDVDAVIRARIRSLRVARGWSLDSLAQRCGLSPSTLSRIETGRRRIALDQVVPICRAFGATLDELVEADGDADVVIRPQPGHSPGQTTWVLSDGDGIHGKTVAKMRIAPDLSGGGNRLGVHPGRDWFTVLSGIARLELGDRTILVHPGEVAEFSTMVPHAICAHEGPVEILTILNHDGGRAHLHGTHAID
ncbi:helix-turn-helix transcriptional regulator [Arthrobacter sp.]|uniref:helix-turn-helix transcriptional regulator n=1 Tax=Arthrobacter sp. TaxID=1667 RepID=UPI0026E07B6D|nr:helix-turn-helix transcriptional regulator [Arthrobacter sp.]MDO5752385.1 helix-turn-helix transcriptional regulator [Arthrobacter sp.]